MYPLFCATDTVPRPVQFDPAISRRYQPEARLARNRFKRDRIESGSVIPDDRAALETITSGHVTHVCRSTIADAVTNACRRWSARHTVADRICDCNMVSGILYRRNSLYCLLVGLMQTAFSLFNALNSSE